MNGYEALANAIIEQAAKDYKSARRMVKRFPNDEKARKRAREIEGFFHSRWFGVLSEADGPELLRRLREEIDHPIRRKRM